VRLDEQEGVEQERGERRNRRSPRSDEDGSRHAGEEVDRGRVRDSEDILKEGDRDCRPTRVGSRSEAPPPDSRWPGRRACPPLER
jgi:hypothetical protein